MCKVFVLSLVTIWDVTLVSLSTAKHGEFAEIKKCFLFSLWPFILWQLLSVYKCLLQKLEADILEVMGSKEKALQELQQQRQQCTDLSLKTAELTKQLDAEKEMYAKSLNVTALWSTLIHMLGAPGNFGYSFAPLGRRSLNNSNHSDPEEGTVCYCSGTVFLLHLSRNSASLLLLRPVSLTQLSALLM